MLSGSHQHQVCFSFLEPDKLMFEWWQELDCGQNRCSYQFISTRCTCSLELLSPVFYHLYTCTCISLHTSGREMQGLKSPLVLGSSYQTSSVSFILERWWKLVQWLVVLTYFYKLEPGKPWIYVIRTLKNLEKKRKLEKAVKSLKFYLVFNARTAPSTLHTSQLQLSPKC